MRIIISLVAVGLLCFLSLPALAQDILVWDKDHNLLFPDPEGAGNKTATYGVTKALDDLGYAYDLTSTPPTDLSNYNILFVVMGTYC